jgi:hypothetical protein
MATRPAREQPSFVPVILHPLAVFTLERAAESLGLGRFALRRAARGGRLRIAYRCRRYYTTGEWLMAWLQAGQPRRKRKNGQATGDSGASDRETAPPPAPLLDRAKRAASRLTPAERDELRQWLAEEAAGE